MNARRRFRPGWRRATVAAVALQVAACSTTATIHRPQGAPLDAHIVGSHENALAVRREDGRDHEVQRPAVAYIDHPGNVLALAGLGVLLVGASIIASEPQPSRGELFATAAIIGTPSLLMIGWGGTTYLRSKRAAARFEDETLRARTPDPNRPYLPAPSWPASPPPAP